MTSTPLNRTVHCEDALLWLSHQPILEGCSMVTSMPDFSEFPLLSLQEWKDWFIAAAALILSRTPDNGVAIFYQTDIRHEGAWIDKGYLCQRAAEQTGHNLLWHKIVCRKEPGTITFGRPGYSHFLCFSRNVKVDMSKTKTNVLPRAGETAWTRGMGTDACLMACRFIMDHTQTRTIVAPFCGHGTALAVANDCGLNAIGIELSPKRAQKARILSFEKNQIQSLKRRHSSDI